jgi:hypothetical protein
LKGVNVLCSNQITTELWEQSFTVPLYALLPNAEKKAGFQTHVLSCGFTENDLFNGLSLTDFE